MEVARAGKEEVYTRPKIEILTKRRIQMAYSKFSGAVCLLVFLPLILTAQRTQEIVGSTEELGDAALLAAQPSGERRAASKAVPQLQFSTNQVSADALTFVAITPCRLVDTRGAAAGFNGIAPFAGPSIAAGATLTFPVQSAAEATANTDARSLRRDSFHRPGLLV